MFAFVSSTHGQDIRRLKQGQDFWGIFDEILHDFFSDGQSAPLAAGKNLKV